MHEEILQTISWTGEAISANVMPPKKGKKPPAHKLCAALDPGFVLKDLKKKEWMIGNAIGSGGFGLLYLADDASKSTVKDDAGYVIKVEPVKNGPLFCEIAFYQRAAKSEDIDKWRKKTRLPFVGIPPYIAHGLHGSGDNGLRFMVMPRCGTDLHKTWLKLNKKFTRTTIAKLAIFMIDALEYMHSMEYVHADIKGANILQGYKDPNNVYLVDFGLATRYMIEGTHKEYKADPRKAHNGTIEYTSVDAHKGAAPSRRGDFEILGFVLVHWVAGKLPWEEKLSDAQKVMELKMAAMKDPKRFVKTSCPSDMPDEILKYLIIVSNLEYEETPDYNKLRNIFKSFLKSTGTSQSSPLDFGAQKPSRISETKKAKPPAKKARTSRPLTSKTNTGSSSAPSINEISSGEVEEAPRRKISSRKQSPRVLDETVSSLPASNDDDNDDYAAPRGSKRVKTAKAPQSKRNRNRKTVDSSDEINTDDSDSEPYTKPTKLVREVKSTRQTKSRTTSRSNTSKLTSNVVEEQMNKRRKATRPGTSSGLNEDEEVIISESSSNEESISISPQLQPKKPNLKVGQKRNASRKTSRAKTSSGSYEEDEDQTTQSTSNEEANDIIPGLDPKKLRDIKKRTARKPETSGFSKTRKTSSKDSSSKESSYDENKANSIIPGLNSHGPVNEGLRILSKKPAKQDSGKAKGSSGKQSSNDKNEANSIIPGLKPHVSPLKENLRTSTKLKSRYSMAPLHVVPVLTDNDTLTGEHVGKHPVFKRKRKVNVPKADSCTQTTPSLKKAQSRR